MTNTTETLAPELVTLRTAYLARVRELIATYPAQAANEMYYLGRVATARLGRIKQTVSPKGSPALERGELVLVWMPEWSLSDSATVWGASSSSDIGCHKWSVEVVA